MLELAGCLTSGLRLLPGLSVIAWDSATGAGENVVNIRRADSSDIL